MLTCACCAAIADGSRQLEFIGGEVWANVWQTECIARICPETGKVKGWLLMHGLGQSLANRNLASNHMDVLNGEEPRLSLLYGRGLKVFYQHSECFNQRRGLNVSINAEVSMFQLHIRVDAASCYSPSFCKDAGS
jgi:hypothetical protein